MTEPKNRHEKECNTTDCQIELKAARLKDLFTFFLHAESGGINWCLRLDQMHIATNHKLELNSFAPTFCRHPTPFNFTAEHRMIVILIRQ